MGFRFVLGKQQKTGKIINEYITLRLKHKKLFKEQLNRLDTQNHHRRIDNTERDRLKTILEAKYCQQQEEDWNHIQERIQ